MNLTNSIPTDLKAPFDKLVSKISIEDFFKKTLDEGEFKKKYSRFFKYKNGTSNITLKVPEDLYLKMKGIGAPLSEFIRVGLGLYGIEVAAELTPTTKKLVSQKICSRCHTEKYIDLFPKSEKGSYLLFCSDCAERGRPKIPSIHKEVFCKKCKQVKPYTDFDFYPGNKVRQKTCRDCLEISPKPALKKPETFLTKKGLGEALFKVIVKYIESRGYSLQSLPINFPIGTRQLSNLKNGTEFSVETLNELPFVEVGYVFREVEIKNQPPLPPSKKMMEVLGLISKKMPVTEITEKTGIKLEDIEAIRAEAKKNGLRPSALVFKK